MKILVLTNYGMGLYKFRKELLQELIAQDNDVYISLPKDEYTDRLTELGCKYIDTKLERRSMNPIHDFALISFYIKTIKIIKPDIVLTYTIKPNIYGGIASRITKTPYLPNVTGLGTSLENKGFMQTFILTLYKIGLKKASCVFFQNKSNIELFTSKGIVVSKKRLIPGSGVNIRYHNYENYPNDDDNIAFLFVGRIMKDKGIGELMEAARRIKARYPGVQFNIVGDFEEDFPADQLLLLNEQGIIKYHGKQDDIHTYIKNSHATILPSYHEGKANVLLESASTGRPVLASNVPGCIETFDEGISGFGFEVKNVDSLVKAIEKFISLPLQKKIEMGINGRKKMEREFNRDIVINAYIEEITAATNRKE